MVIIVVFCRLFLHFFHTLVVLPPILLYDHIVSIGLLSKHYAINASLRQPHEGYQLRLCCILYVWVCRKAHYHTKPVTISIFIYIHSSDHSVKIPKEKESIPTLIERMYWNLDWIGYSSSELYDKVFCSVSYLILQCACERFACVKINGYDNKTS